MGAMKSNQFAWWTSAINSFFKNEEGFAGYGKAEANNSRQLVGLTSGSVLNRMLDGKGSIACNAN